MSGDETRMVVWKDVGGRMYIKDEYVETREWRARKGRGWKEYV